MTTRLLRPLLTLTLAASLLSPLVACGKEKRIKECAARCKSDEQSCVSHKEKDCGGKAKTCGEACEKL
jgi:hypothetical protein